MAGSQKGQQPLAEGWLGMAGSRLIRGRDTWQLRVYLGRDGHGRVRATCTEHSSALVDKPSASSSVS
jgi:hypothetical protein